ncbi:MAG: domain S-box protein [Frankiales bacterium]|nr:domain S-box protein [Frankiales bacterium]
MGVRRLVAIVAALGLIAQGCAVLGLGDRPALAPIAGLAWAHGWLVAACFVLTLASDWARVRVQHRTESGTQTEDLTFFEAACVVDVLVLPASWALVVPVAATLLCSLLRRRGATKSLFNAGNLAVGVAVMVTSTQLLSHGQGLSARTVLGLTIGMLGLCAVNLVALSLVLSVVADQRPWQVIRDGAKLAAIIAVFTVAVGGTFVTLASVAPTLLPFSMMPVAALMFAFQSRADEASERERSQRLLALSQMLAGRLDGDVLSSFLDLGRQAFGVDLALALLDPTAAPGGAYPLTVCDDREFGRDRRAASLYEADLLWHTESATLITDGLPEDWRAALVAPLEADGRRIGVVVLASRVRKHGLKASDVNLLNPLASALAVALRAAAQLERLEEERSKLKAVVDQSSDGILVLNGRGVVQLWSPAMEALTGRTEVTALGRPIAALLAMSSSDGTPLDLFASGRDQMSVDQPHVVVELVITRDDGDRRVVRCAHAGVFDGEELVRDVVMLHDVTRERQVERLKADFIATVSHELRTPVTPIKGYADLLRRRGHAMTEAKRNECLDVISDRASHLTRLVEDLLLASRISATESSGRGKVDMGSDDLVALVRRSCGDFGDQGSRLTLDVPATPVLVDCDPMRVIQVLSNLVSNALKYSGSASQVVVRLRTAGARAVVEVQDSGRGIPADQVDKVFDKFHRVEDPMLMTTGGTGLGLYIARELAAAMGGSLTCASTLGVGSVFTLSLCVANSDGAEAAATEPQAAPSVVPVEVPRPRRAPPWVTTPPRPERADGVIAP